MYSGLAECGETKIGKRGPVNDVVIWITGEGGSGREGGHSLHLVVGASWM